MSKKLILIGASGHGKVVADIATKNGYAEIAFLDDNPEVKDCGGFPVVGTSKDFLRYKQWDFVVAIGNTSVRQKIQTVLEKEGLHIASLIHPNAVIADDVRIAEGSVVMAGTVINPGTRIGKGCIVNTCASVDHDCQIGDYTHVSVGAHVAGTVKVGCATWIGAGAIVSNNVEISENCMIGAGAVVVKNITQAGTYIGVPARKVK